MAAAGAGHVQASGESEIQFGYCTHLIMRPSESYAYYKFWPLWKGGEGMVFGYVGRFPQHVCFPFATSRLGICSSFHCEHV